MLLLRFIGVLFHRLIAWPQKKCIVSTLVNDYLTVHNMSPRRSYILKKWQSVFFDFFIYLVIFAIKKILKYANGNSAFTEKEIIEIKWQWIFLQLTLWHFFSLLFYCVYVCVCVYMCVFWEIEYIHDLRKAYICSCIPIGD